MVVPGYKVIEVKLMINIWLKIPIYLETIRYVCKDLWEEEKLPIRFKDRGLNDNENASHHPVVPGSGSKGLRDLSPQQNDDLTAEDEKTVTDRLWGLSWGHTVNGETFVPKPTDSPKHRWVSASGLTGSCWEGTAVYRRRISDPVPKAASGQSCLELRVRLLETNSAAGTPTGHWGLTD